MDQNPPLHKQSETEDASCDKSTKQPTEFTTAKHQAVLNELPFSNKQDFVEASNGWRATRNVTTPTTQSGFYNVKIDKFGPVPIPVWNLGDYAFLAPPPALPDKPAPNTVDPSLWRQAKLNMNNGLFEVATRSVNQVIKGIYQVRAFDLSNMTIVEGDTGIIIIDPLISAECAKAALDLYRFYRQGTGPVKAIIYTHSHIDHYGGVNGVVNEADVGTGPGKVQIYAPTGFLDHAISENAYAGNAMGRRASYMYGTFLPKSVFGQIDGGLGKGVSTGDTV